MYPSPEFDAFSRSTPAAVSMTVCVPAVDCTVRRSHFSEKSVSQRVYSLSPAAFATRYTVRFSEPLDAVSAVTPGAPALTDVTFAPSFVQVISFPGTGSSPAANWTSHDARSTTSPASAQSAGEEKVAVRMTADDTVRDSAGDAPYSAGASRAAVTASAAAMRTSLLLLRDIISFSFRMTPGQSPRPWQPIIFHVYYASKQTPCQEISPVKTGSAIAKIGF